MGAWGLWACRPRRGLGKEAALLGATLLGNATPLEPVDDNET